MNVFIMRHGEAETHAETDMSRELSHQGREDIAQMASTYSDELAQVDVIWCSSYTRAQQTADIVAQRLQKPIITQSILPPSGNPADVMAALEAHKHQTILVVSHQPLIGILVDGLADLEPGRYRMGTGALAHLKTDIYARGCAELRWLHQPASIQPSLNQSI